MSDTTSLDTFNTLPSASFPVLDYWQRYTPRALWDSTEPSHFFTNHIIFYYHHWKKAFFFLPKCIIHQLVIHQQIIIPSTKTCTIYLKSSLSLHDISTIIYRYPLKETPSQKRRTNFPTQTHIVISLYQSPHTLSFISELVIFLPHGSRAAFCLIFLIFYFAGVYIPP